MNGSLLKSFERVEILSIDVGAARATLRMRFDPGLGLEFAIDPMSLILSGSAYLRWVEMRHPHVPKVAEIQAAIRTMSPDERAAALTRARIMADYGAVVQRAIGSM